MKILRTLMVILFMLWFASQSWAALYRDVVTATITLTNNRTFQEAELEESSDHDIILDPRMPKVELSNVPDLKISSSWACRPSGITIKHNRYFVMIDFDSIKKVVQLPDGQIEAQLLDKPGILNQEFARRAYEGLDTAIEERSIRGYPTPEKFSIKYAGQEQKVELKQVQSIEKITYDPHSQREFSRPWLWRGSIRAFQATVIPFEAVNEIRFLPGKLQVAIAEKYSLDCNISEDWNPGNYLMLEKNYGVIVVPLSEIVRVRFKQLIKFDQYDAFQIAHGNPEKKIPELNIQIRDTKGIQHNIVWLCAYSNVPLVENKDSWTIEEYLWHIGYQALTFQMPDQLSTKSFWVSFIKEIKQLKNGLYEVLLQNGTRFRAYWVKNNPQTYQHESSEEVLYGQEDYYGSKILFEIKTKDIAEFKVIEAKKHQAFINKALSDCLLNARKGKIILRNGLSSDGAFVYISDGGGYWSRRVWRTILVDSCEVWTAQAPTENINDNEVKEAFIQTFPLSNITKIRFMNQTGIQGCPTVSITLNDGHVRQRSIVMHSESYGGAWYYGMMGNDQVIAVTLGQLPCLVSFPLSQVKEIVY